MIVKNRIEGTRISVWDVLHYLENGWSCLAIAEILRLNAVQVEDAARYIAVHKEALLVVHRQIEGRKARGNPPEIATKVAKSRIKLQEWLQSHRDTKT